MARDLADNDSTRPGNPYRGRFAPSPSGPLHFGSLVAAIASYLQALTHDGEWLLRIEDIDPPREVAGATDKIIDALDAHGFQWHGEVLYQRHHTQRFADLVTSLLDDGLAYACTCSRDQIRQVAHSGPTGLIYPGTCRSRAINPGNGIPTAIRLRTSGAVVTFDDALQGRVECNLEQRIGDFIIRRKDGLIAYNLAVVVDDHDQGITEIVRGADLFDVTPAHIHLQQLLGLRQPTYCHVPMVLNRAGDKLSKQTGASAIDNSRAAENLVRGLRFLGHTPPRELATGAVDEVWSWARANWNLPKLAQYAKTGLPNSNNTN